MRLLQQAFSHSIIIIILIIKILYLGEYSPLRTFVPPQDKICCPQPAGLN
jgi:hypothetical protein